jgi:hypothetical protein
MERFIEQYLSLQAEYSGIQGESCITAEKLAQLEVRKCEEEEKRYIRLEDGSLKALTTLQAELVDIVGADYDADGKTKDERAANLLRYVRAQYPEYNEWENQIQESEYELRAIKGRIASLTESAKVQQKCLMGIQAKIETVGKIIEALSRSQGNITLAEMERRLSDRIDAVTRIVEQQHGEINQQKAVLKEMVSAL